MPNETDSLLRAPEERGPPLQRRQLMSLLALLGIVTLVVLAAIFVYSKSRFFIGHHSLLPAPTSTTKSQIDEDEPLAPRYTATQFVSFTINTMGGLAEHGECQGRSVDENGVCYLGSDNITEDVFHRLEIVKEVLARLKDDINRKDPEIDHRDDVLKIFAMPEFFWRGPNGAYTDAQIFEDRVLLELGDETRRLVKDEAFSHYLFLFGTVIAIFAPEEDEEWVHPLNAKEIDYSNFCYVIKGGPHHLHRFLVTKRYISAVDFLNRAHLPNPRLFNVSEYKYTDFSDRFTDLLKERGTVLVNDNFILLDGLKIGIEICLDHRLGALWDSLKQNHNSELVDVLVVVSAGMAIERGPNPVVPGGVVYLSDGEASSAACYRSDKGDFDPLTVCRAVGPDGRKHLPLGGTNYSEFFTMSACLDVERSTLLKGYFSLYQTQGCAYTLKIAGIDFMDEFMYYPPSLEIYPTVDLNQN